MQRFFFGFLALAILVVLLSVAVIFMDGLTHGGLFKNEGWQQFRKLWM